jgi:hypothetical protein
MPRQNTAEAVRQSIEKGPSEQREVGETGVRRGRSMDGQNIGSDLPSSAEAPTVALASNLIAPTPAPFIRTLKPVCAVAATLAPALLPAD